MDYTPEAFGKVSCLCILQHEPYYMAKENLGSPAAKVESYICILLPWCLLRGGSSSSSNEEVTTLFAYYFKLSPSISDNY